MLNQGALLAYPTESVWGIGCDAYCDAAVMQVLAIKQRPMDKGMIVITDSAERITALLTGLSESQRSQVVSSWQDNHQGDLQQAQTWLLPVPSNLTVSVPKWITGQHPSVAVRVITHPLIRQLCAHLVSESNPFGFIVSTSCNPSGQPPATTVNEAYGYFGEQIGYLDAPTLGYTQPSRIRDALTGHIVR